MRIPYPQGRARSTGTFEIPTSNFIGILPARMVTGLKPADIPGRCKCPGSLAKSVFAFLTFLAGSWSLDALALPRAKRVWPLRSLPGTVLLWLLAGLPLGLFLAIGGNQAVSISLALAVVGLLTMVSNAKRRLLGEALVFSDLALLGAVFRHPQFYFSALTLGQKALLTLAAPVVPILLWVTSSSEPTAHIAGLVVSAGCAGLAWLAMHLAPWYKMAPSPDSENDIARHGLIPTMLVHWLRWRSSTDPLPPLLLSERLPDDELVVMIQCESFADPVDLFADSTAELPGLAAARAVAWMHGNLEVHGFGAYTMRTEYGVLFGRDEAALGFRRFDPFLTAVREAHHALPARLSPTGWRSLFVHPHDMGFYDRDRIMPAAGFCELVGEDRFTPPGPADGRYVTDAAMADEILALSEAAAQPTLIYAVTIENHGPWSQGDGHKSLRDDYVRLLSRSDTMLARLMDGIASLRRPAMLVFFGDHRPSIPSVSMPGGDRHTPYVVVRFDAEGRPRPGSKEPINLSPADLHHTVLNLLARAAGASEP